MIVGIGSKERYVPIRENSWENGYPYNQCQEQYEQQHFESVFLYERLYAHTFRL